MANLSRPRPEKHVLGNWIPHSEKRTSQDVADLRIPCLTRRARDANQWCLHDCFAHMANP